MQSPMGYKDIPVVVGNRSLRLNSFRDVSCTHDNLLQVHMTQQHHRMQLTTFCMLNARSIKNKTDEFVEFVREKDLDVIGISETWLTPNDPAVIAGLTPNGYSFHHVP